MPRGAMVAIAAFILFATVLAGTSSVHAQAGPALSGKGPDGQGALEGVLVSAKKSGSTVTVTVVSDKDGRYNFPATRLEPGQYSLRVRAAGFELADPGPVSVAADKPATADLTLRKNAHIASPL